MSSVNRASLADGWSRLVWSRRSASHLICQLFLVLALAGCCDLRSAIDESGKGPNAFQPVVVGSPIFSLEVYEYSNFDLAHHDLGQRFISMRNGDLRPVGQHYARSLKLKAGPNTGLEVIADNGHRGSGKVGPTRQLEIKDLCFDNEDHSYTTDGQMSCNVTGIVIRRAGK